MASARFSRAVDNNSVSQGDMRALLFEGARLAAKWVARRATMLVDFLAPEKLAAGYCAVLALRLVRPAMQHLNISGSRVE